MQAQQVCHNSFVVMRCLPHCLAGSTHAQAVEKWQMVTCLMLTAGLFYHLLHMTAYVFNVEYVVVDMSPSGGMTNQNILMSSDAFFMPTAIDPKVRDA